MVPEMRQRMESGMTSEQELIWLAGLLEGEGCFTTTAGRKAGTQISIQLQMTDKDVVERAARIMESSCSPRKRPDKSNYKQIFYCQLRDARAYSLMEKLLPYMGARRTRRIQELFDIYKRRVTPSEARLRYVAHTRKCEKTLSLW